jgi:peptidylprolyl isomerase
MLKTMLYRAGLMTFCCLIVACTQASDTQQTSTPSVPATEANATTTPSVPATEPKATPTPITNAKNTITTPSGLKYVDLKVGTGATPKQGQTVSVQYTGTLENGTKFDSSRDTALAVAKGIAVSLLSFHLVLDK